MEFEQRCAALARSMGPLDVRFYTETRGGELVYRVSVSPERLWERVTVHVSPRLGYAVCCLACGEDIPCAHAGSALLRAQGRAEAAREVA